MSTVMPQNSETVAPRRRFTLWHLSIILLLVGLAITGYLSYEHFAGNEVACVGGPDSAFDCDAVNSSIYSQFMGIYVGYLGLFADIFMLAVMLLEKRISILRDYGVIIIFAVALLGFIYHDYLTYVAITRIGKLCLWCLTEHTIMTLLLIVTSIRLYRTLMSSGEAEEA
ncbi:MAG: vitamin K epoxide reductase family protein [Chloroflexota bacterium]